MRTPRPVPLTLAVAPFAGSTAPIGRGTMAGPRYRRLARGAYWVAGEEVTHGRMIQAMLAVLPDDVVLRGWSAAWMWGLCWARDDDPVEVAMPHARRVRSRTGLQVSGEELGADEVVEREGVRVTTPARTAFDLGRRLAHDQAVAAMDALLRIGGAKPEEVRAVAARHLRASGRRQALAAAASADPRSESPRESLLRLAVQQAGLPPPVPQFEVRVDGRFVARLDLAWPELKVALEYDGAHHRDRDQYGRDLTRHNALRAAGWVVFQVDAAQWPRLDAVLADVARELAKRGARR